MSYCREEGKDKIIFVTREDHEEPSTADIDFEDDDDDEPGLILPNGDINWNCPCLGGMATGPCGEEFKEAFSCFHYSAAEIKGSDCIDQFRTMQECMRQYPELYPEKDDEEEAEKGQGDTAPSSDVPSKEQKTEDDTSKTQETKS
ncbi:mitochondrial intermembrane space import and assembly protein 40-B-like [Ptychodera flava]|uniref:mitochondrial intermembrane space import and assembly protein 40-B-like n=1 Tax=Ptychodera flava TaxID=63121 RepID=UPI00396A68BB